MKNNLFLDYYQHLQYQVMYHKLIDLEFASIGVCKTYDSPVFNMALIDDILDEKQIKETEQVFFKLKRKPAFYFENTKKLNPFIKKITTLGYKKNWEDSWMFYENKEVDKNRFNLVEKVETQSQLETFLNTFDKCYQKDDPQNPYGELGDYVDVARNCWKWLHKTDRIEYFTVYHGSKPVAVSTLTNFAGIGYISNVGSLREVRGKGFGKLATWYCVEKSKQNKNTEHCLATEEGQYPNEFYKRIGFITRFTALGYVKQ